MWRRQWQPTPVFLPGKSHGQRSPVGCSPWGHCESDMTEHLRFHFSLSCITEGNGSPLQCSCLENPRDSGAWWAAIYGVAQSRTRLKQLSSSSSIHPIRYNLIILERLNLKYFFFLLVEREGWGCNQESCLLWKTLLKSFHSDFDITKCH